MAVIHTDPPGFDKIPASDMYANASIVSISTTSKLVQFAGQPGRDPEDGNVPTELEAQIDNVLKRFSGLLEHVGAKKTDITHIVYYVANHLKAEDLMALGPKFGVWLEGNRPAASLVKVAGFLNPQYLVEVDMTAVMHEAA